jgi:hypothetical protein
MNILGETTPAGRKTYEFKNLAHKDLTQFAWYGNNIQDVKKKCEHEYNNVY